MLLHRLLIVMLICCVTVREDFSFLLSSVSRVGPFHAQYGSVDEGSAHDGELVAELDDESESADEAVPLPDELPPDDSEIPVIVEVELDPEAEEALYLGDHISHFVFVGHCLSSEDNASSFDSFNSFCTLKRLRT